MGNGIKSKISYLPRYIIDSWSWIEYFKGSWKGKLIIDKIEIAENYTSSISLAEIKSWFIYHRKEEFNELLKFIRAKSKIIEMINEEAAIRGGENQGTDKRNKKDAGKDEKPISYIDGLLMALAEQKNLKVVTGDRHFKNFPLSEYIG